MDSSKQLKRMMGNRAEFHGVQVSNMRAIRESESYYRGSGTVTWYAKDCPR
jgi:hypothetical protein